ncbi:protein of unknown function [Candidatus Nitrotoga arctica]|uniref:Transposase DDE domain-containing protein n=1 Tax=Candidatus Nitrotoga arctica TaxID=453162 RepID=A0ABM8YV85_9PROT|nr:protein of unknown function [Candidatus Nitrotoga arctica]
MEWSIHYIFLAYNLLRFAIPEFIYRLQTHILYITHATEVSIENIKPEKKISLIS